MIPIHLHEFCLNATCGEDDRPQNWTLSLGRRLCLLARGESNSLDTFPAVATAAGNARFSHGRHTRLDSDKVRIILAIGGIHDVVPFFVISLAFFGSGSSSIACPRGPFPNPLLLAFLLFYQSPFTSL